MVLKKETGWEMGDGGWQEEEEGLGRERVLEAGWVQGAKEVEAPWMGPESRCSWGASQKGRVSS